LGPGLIEWTGTLSAGIRTECSGDSKATLAQLVERLIRNLAGEQATYFLDITALTSRIAIANFFGQHFKTTVILRPSELQPQLPRTVFPKQTTVPDIPPYHLN
jgi:hypothetical protein